jgi:general secretion pathway protein L
MWWGQLHAHQAPAWLVRAANGEAARLAPALLEAAISGARQTQDSQRFADPASATPPPATPGGDCAELSAAALVRRAAVDPACWDLRQFGFAPPGAAERLISACAGLVRQSSGRFAIAAVLALLGLNLYALKQRRAIDARHGEMERIVTQALPHAPQLLEPALQLEAAWQRARGGTQSAGAATLLGFLTQTGNAQGITALDVSERALRATYADAAALERAWASCQSAALSARLQHAGVRWTRDGTRLLLDRTRDPATAAAAPLSESRPC